MIKNSIMINNTALHKIIVCSNLGCGYCLLVSCVTFVYVRASLLYYARANFGLLGLETTARSVHAP